MVCDQGYLKEYIAPGNIEPFATKSLNNSEVLVAGKGTLSANSLYKAMAVKLSSNGSVLWSIMVGGNVDDRFTGITLLNDGSYLLYGTTTSFGRAGGKVLLVHVTNNGNVIWSRQLGLPGNTIDRIKAMAQFSDGNLIGTFNSNDSSQQSNPVVFKIGLDGTPIWARRFDNHSATSFTSIAFENNNIYVGGFYTDGKRNGVISTINGTDGSVIASQKIYSADTSFDQEVANMEVYNNQISYGLWLINNISNKMYISQADMSGNKIFETFIDDWADNEALFLKRTPDGFLLLSSMDHGDANPDVVKFNKFNLIEWSSFQSDQSYGRGQKNYEADVTPAGGSVSAGYYNDYTTGEINKMIIARTNAVGDVGGCGMHGNTFVTDTATILSAPFSWIAEPPLTILMNDPISPTTTAFNIVESKICDSTFCTDITPLPPGCNKTSLVEYDADQPTNLRDFISKGDGGKIAVGDIALNGFIAGFKDNGDVNWAKIIGSYQSNEIFKRIIRSKDNDIIAFGNKYRNYTHYNTDDLNIVKLDNNGNILTSELVQLGIDTQISDVFATSDGGFVALLNGDWGTGYTYSYVIRFDANLRVVWKKEIKHSVATPVYRSIFCADNGVFIASDSYDSYNTDKVGLQKLDFSTGQNVWSKRFVFTNKFVNINKLIVSDDTLYTFINNFTPINPFMTQKSVYLLKVTNAGSIIDAMSLEGDDLTYLDFHSFDYLDVDRPTVTITPEKDFVMSNQAITPDGLQLNISRFDKNGKVLWSKNYPDLSSHFVYNIHPDAKGFSIVGTVKRPADLTPLFTNSFLLKVDSSGEIMQGAIGNCASKQMALSVSPVNVGTTDSGIDSVVDLKGLSIVNNDTLTMDISYDATLYCNQKSSCPPVVLSSLKNDCTTKDTLTYYLGGNNCGAIAMWRYDSTFFKLVSSSDDTIKLFPLKQGTVFIYATIEDDCSSQIDSTLATVLLKASSLNLGADTTICSGSSLMLKAGLGYQSYLWSTSSTDSIITVSSPGIYFVKVTDNCGLTGTDSIRVSLIENNFHITGTAEKCNEDTVTLSANAGLLKYQWSPSLNLVSNGNTAKVDPSQTTYFYLTAEALQGCIIKDSFQVKVKTSPPLNLGNDTSICTGKSITLMAAAGFKSYQWSNGDQSSSIEVIAPDLYLLSATYPNNCVSRDTIQIKNFPLAVPYLGKDTSICSGTGIRLFPGNYKSYEWSNGVTNDNSITVNNKGTYWVKVIDQNNCTASDTINILNVYDSPENFLTGTTEICYGDVVILQSTKEFTKYLWSTGDAGNFITVKDTGTFQLSVTDQHGCIGTESTNVTLKPDCPSNIYVPNAFTPNNDGLNEQFKPIIKGDVEKYSFKIYSRFGQVIFSTNNRSIAWDGRFKGQLAPGDIYVWYCNYQFKDKPMKTEKGIVTLIR